MPIKETFEYLQSAGYVFSIEGTTISFERRGQRIDVPEKEITFHLNILRENKSLAIWYLMKKGKEKAKPIAVDIETTSLKPSKGEIILISTTDAEGSSVFREINCELKHILESEEYLKIFHNALFDVTWLLAKGIVVKNYTCTMIMAQIINHNSKEGVKLSDLAYKYMRILLDKSLQHSDNWQEEITAQHLEYAKKDAEITFNLYPILMKRIESLFLEEVLEQELRFIPAVVKLALDGMKIDKEALQEQIDIKTIEKNELELKLKDELIVENLNSPIQLKSALNKKGIPVEGTSEKELKQFEDNTIIFELLTYKKLFSFVTKFGPKILSMIDIDSRIRASWRQIGTATGRMSCSEPNLQSLPTTAKHTVVAENGNIILSADFSNIEVRVLADISQDEMLIRAFKDNKDLHKITAAKIFNIKEVDVTNEQRKIGKIVNFSTIYGVTAYGLQRTINANGVKITLKEAEEYRNAYLNYYSGVQRYVSSSLTKSSIKSKLGRHWDRNTSELERGSNKRLNYAIQATAAEGFKESVIEVMKAMKESWKLIVLVHDSIVIEVPQSEKEMAEAILQKAMIKGMSRFIQSVPIVVEIKTGNSWKN